FTKQKNLFDFVTLLFQYQQYEEGFKYLNEVRDESLQQGKLFYLALYYIEKNNRFEAMKHLNSLISLNPEHGAALNNLAVFYAKEGDHEKAKNLFEKAIQLFPGYMDATDNLRALEEGKGEYRFTKRELRKNLL